MDALLPLWIIGSVLVLAVVDRISIKSGKTTYASSRDSFTQRPGTVVAG